MEQMTFVEVPWWWVVGALLILIALAGGWLWHIDEVKSLLENNKNATWALQREVEQLRADNWKRFNIFNKRHRRVK